MKLDKKALGEKIASIRREQGLTLEEFGELVECASKSNVSKWERGLHVPSNSRLKIIAELGKITVDELLYGASLRSIWLSTGTQLTLNKEESISVLDMIQDCIDRGMISSNYEVERISELIKDFEGEFDDWEIEDIEIVINVKGK